MNADNNTSDNARRADWRAFRTAQAQSFEKGGDPVSAIQFTIRGQWNDLPHLRKRLDSTKGVERDGRTVTGATCHPNDEWEVVL